MERDCPQCGGFRQMTIKAKTPHIAQFHCPACKKYQNCKSSEVSHIPCNQKRATLNTPVCPSCNLNMGKTRTNKGGRHSWKCKSCKKQYSDTRIKLNAKKENALSLGNHLGFRQPNKLGVRGIHFEERTGKYRFHITKDRKCFQSQRYVNLIDAMIAYNFKAKELHGPNAFQHDLSVFQDPRDYEYGTKGAAISFANCP